MSSPTIAAVPVSVTSSVSTQNAPPEKLKADVSNRPFDPYATLILLSSLALHPDNSRVGYRQGNYSAVHHLVRNEPKLHFQEDTTPTSSPSASLFSKVQNAASSVVLGATNMVASTAAYAATAYDRQRQGSCSERDLPRIEEVFIRFVRNNLKTLEDIDLLTWAIKGLGKIARGYGGEPKTKSEIEAIMTIGLNALGLGPSQQKILPSEYRPYFGLDWTPDDICSFHKKLKPCFHLLDKAMPDVDEKVKQGITQKIKHLIGVELQKEIEDALKPKADQYEQYIRKVLNQSENSHSHQNAQLSPSSIASVPQRNSTNPEAKVAQTRVNANQQQAASFH